MVDYIFLPVALQRLFLRQCCEKPFCEFEEDRPRASKTKYENIIEVFWERASDTFLMVYCAQLIKCCVGGEKITVARECSKLGDPL